MIKPNIELPDNTFKKPKCDKCGNTKFVQEYGHNEQFIDSSFFPKFLCINCAREWSKVYKKVTTNDDFEWIREFKKWYNNYFERVC